MFKRMGFFVAMAALLVAGGWMAYQVSVAAAPPPDAHITITAADFRYESDTIFLKPGQKVHLKFDNHGSVLHEIIFEGFKDETGDGIGTKADPGQSNIADFTAPAAGAYVFLCTLPGHQQAGMVGKLLVR